MARKRPFPSPRGSTLGRVQKRPPLSEKTRRKNNVGHGDPVRAPIPWRSCTLVQPGPIGHPALGMALKAPPPAPRFYVSVCLFLPTCISIFVSNSCFLPAPSLPPAPLLHHVLSSISFSHAPAHLTVLTRSSLPSPLFDWLLVGPGSLCPSPARRGSMHPRGEAPGLEPAGRG